jgi:methylenetetrahydrofolate dehydrogenase (NADP+)/methenyltetrahydrofolate cyclohydrolase
MARILDGKAVAKVVRGEVKVRAAAVAVRGVEPRISLVRVGDDPASESYVRTKARMCKKAGIHSEIHAMPADYGTDNLDSLVAELNTRDDVHGILVQFPLPEGYDAARFQEAVVPSKDVDGLNPVNIGRTAAGREGFVPCTPLGVQRMLEHYEISTQGKRVVIVGRSNLVGRPLANLLSQRGLYADATVTVAHSRSENLPAVCREADILVAAAGRAGLVTADMVKAGAVVIDVDIHRVETDGGSRLVGDVDFEAVEPLAAAISPVPGGVGPMTVAMLLSNTVASAERFADERGR